MTLLKLYNRNSACMPEKSGMEMFFNDYFEGPMIAEKTNWLPSVNVSESPSDYRIQMAVPGINKEDIRIEVEEGNLSIEGQRKFESGEETVKFSRREIFEGKFRRTFRLPETADWNNISASSDNGMLTVVIAKKEEAKPAPKKEIKIS